MLTSGFACLVNNVRVICCKKDSTDIVLLGDSLRLYVTLLTFAEPGSDRFQIWVKSHCHTGVLQYLALSK
jgi:hypothetical protein